MHLLNTGLITATFPTQIVGVAYGPTADDPTGPQITAFISVEIDGVQNICEVAKPSHHTCDPDLSLQSVKEWNELTENSEVVPRTVTLVAMPTSDVGGAAHFAVTQIDLRVEEGVDRYFAAVIR